MRDLYTYLKEMDGCSTPANTMGMGNPGMASDGRGEVLTEPVGSIDGCAHCIRQNEKPKKKKRKIKESLFDDDIVEKDIYIGDIVDLEGWGDADPGKRDWHDTSLRESFPASRVDAVARKPKWKKFLNPFSKNYSMHDLKWTSFEYDFSRLFYFLTWVIMCCRSNKEIESKVSEFLKETLDEHKGVIAGSYFKYYVKKIEVFAIKGRKDQGPLRMVAIKFYTEDSKYNFCFHCTFNPKS